MSKWSEYMRSDAGQLEVEKQYAAALREEVDRLKEELRCVSKDRESWRDASRENNVNRIRMAEQSIAKDAEITRLREALRLALGEEGEFPERRPGEGAYWWRKELRERAALAPQGQEGPEQASGPSDGEMLDWLIQSGAHVAYSRDREHCWLHWAYGLLCDDEEIGVNQKGVFDSPRDSIRAAMKASGAGMEGESDGLH